jgi:hypothetical protein
MGERSRELGKKDARNARTFSERTTPFAPLLPLLCQEGSFGPDR